MWKDFDPTPYSREAFAAHVAKLHWTDWKPQGICLHNTAAPTLKQWVESGPAHDARIRNLQAYYEQQQGWHQGPHLFISRNWINGFSSMLEPGVHSRCFNATHIGIEMVGDYNAEEFNSGDGALVRDNAVFALATLFKAIGVNPSTLLFHVDCKIDNHDCPGKNVHKGDMIGRVAMLMSGGTLPAQPAPLMPQEPWTGLDWPIDPKGSYRTAWIQDSLNKLSPTALAIRVDGLTGPLTSYAVRRFQHEQNLQVDGVAGPITVSVIKDMLNLKGK